MSDAIVPAPPSAIQPSSEIERARQEVSQARQRVLQQLHTIEASLPRVPDWRKAVRLRPLLTLGGAFFAGWAIARLFSRPR
jgi:hypothetical protein